MPDDMSGDRERAASAADSAITEAMVLAHYCVMHRIDPASDYRRPWPLVADQHREAIQAALDAAPRTPDAVRRPSSSLPPVSPAAVVAGEDPDGPRRLNARDAIGDLIVSHYELRASDGEELHHDGIHNMVAAIEQSVYDSYRQRNTDVAGEDPVANVVNAARVVDALLAPDKTRAGNWRFDGVTLKDGSAAADALLSLHDYLNDVDNASAGRMAGEDPETRDNVMAAFVAGMRRGYFAGWSDYSQRRQYGSSAGNVATAAAEYASGALPATDDQETKHDA